MGLLFPSQDTLHSAFHPAIRSSIPKSQPQKLAQPKRSSLDARAELYTTWSVVEDAKNKAGKLSAEASKEFELASEKAKAKAGHIELYSAKYYAACTFGGLLACVSLFLLFDFPYIACWEDVVSVWLGEGDCSDEVWTMASSKEFSKFPLNIFIALSRTLISQFNLTSSQGLTHTFVTPLDLVKCRRQVDSKLYTGNFQAWSKIGRAEGFRGIYTGWSPTFFGYSAQGAFKYGGYEYFKKFYSDVVGVENAHKYKTSIYLVASASAEFIADIA